MKPKLRKRVCKACIDTAKIKAVRIDFETGKSYDGEKGWCSLDEKSWRRGNVSCPKATINGNIYKKPQQNCNYKLEHMVLNRKRK